jgi:predicted SPOUT superfamily RNA methylase MTH1
MFTIIVHDIFRIKIILKIYSHDFNINIFDFFQIARAATLFCVDEIIVYNEYAMENK